MILSPAQQAMQLATTGRPADGLLVLKKAQEEEVAEAFLLEGLWLLEGRFVPRDLLAARTPLGRAADLGHVGAARTLAGLMASGVGAPSDWEGAVAMLKRWSDRDPIAAKQLHLIGRMSIDGQGWPTGEFVSRDLCADPLVQRVNALFTPQECAFLIELADPRMRRATIFHDAEQRFVEDPIRRSDKAAFPIVSEWPFVRAINMRIAAATGTAVDCGEPLQVLRYGETQEYRPHFDAIAGMANPRVLTALVWLNDDYSGGETRFDELGISERGTAGDLLVFANTLADGSPDPRTRHSGAPVTVGVKYLASRWIRAKPPGEEGFGRHEVERR
ncbi:MAG TPA: 2OG-Fe(II) oxygenase [Sphingomicrobium sp.]